MALKVTDVSASKAVGKNLARNLFRLPSGVTSPAEQCSADELVVGVVSRENAGYKIAESLAAFAEAQTSRRNLMMVVVGKGPELAAWQHCAAQLSISERVHFVGEQDDLAGCVSSFDILLLPFYGNGIPMALLEAMAAKTPVIAYSVGRIPKILEDGRRGYLVSPGDISAVGQAIVALAEDDSLRFTFAARAQQYVREMHGASLVAGQRSYGYSNERQASRSRRVAKRLLALLLRQVGVLRHGNRNSPQFALTFDDGPDPIYTPQILKILQAHEVRATFFLVGNRVEEQPQLVRLIVDEGHEIGNHSYSHPYFHKITTAAATKEITDTAAILHRFQQSQELLFRPPFGLSMQALVSAWRTKHRIAMWSLDTKDFRATSSDEILLKVNARAILNGDIILYHGTNPHAIAALPHVIETARANGRSGVVLSGLTL